MNDIRKHKIASILSFTFLLVIIADANAQHSKTTGLSEEVMAWTKSTLEPWPPDRYKSLKEAMIDNNFYVPVVFRGGMFPELKYEFNRDSIALMGLQIPPALTYENKRVKNLFRYQLLKKQLEDSAYKNVMLKDPRNFRYRIKQLPDKPEKVIKSKSIDKSGEQVKLEVKTTVVTPEAVDPIVKFIPDRRYWKSSFFANIQFSQSKSSANWYKGKIDNINIITQTNTSYNYERDRISLTNNLYTTLTFNNVPNDTLRDYTIGSDELRYRSVFGLKAIRNWKYSTTADFITSMGNKYIANTKNKHSAFLAPFTLNLGVGMTYDVNPKFKKPNRSVGLSLTLDPLSFKYMYSTDKKINLPAFFSDRNEDGTYKHVFRSFGSSLTMTNKVRFNKNVTIENSRLYYFTNYERVFIEFDNTVKVILSKYFSTTFQLYLRYDDAVAKAPDSDTYLQVYELFSFGFSYTW
ncbi:MAG: DUF3078 domain-containing protein [Tannerella sp.]|jgi:hypothetical protein|nr:DUF3078 domain-containing protein [Tannerella sp.]